MTLHRLISAALESEAVGPTLTDLGYDIIAEGPRPFATRITADVVQFAEVVRDAGIRVQ